MRATTTTAPRSLPSTSLHGWTGACHPSGLPQQDVFTDRVPGRYSITNTYGESIHDGDTYCYTYSNSDLPGKLYDSYCHWHDNRRRYRYRQPLRRLLNADRSTFPGQCIWRSGFVAFPASNGDLHFAEPRARLFYYEQCVPVDPTPPDGPFLNTLFPFYDDLRTDETGICPDCGIFTQTLGTAPHRQFVIRWKTTFFTPPAGGNNAEFEVILTEGSDTLSVIYGDTSGDNGLTAASGIQQDLTHFHVVLLLRRNPDIRRACGLHTHRLWQSHADPDGESDGNSYRHSDDNSYSHTDGNSYRHSDDNSYSYTDGHGHCHSDGNSYCHTDGHGHGDRYGYSHA